MTTPLCEFDARCRMSEVQNAIDDLESLLDRRRLSAGKLIAATERYLRRLTNGLPKSGGINEEQVLRLSQYRRRIMATGRRLRHKAA